MKKRGSEEKLEKLLADFTESLQASELFEKKLAKLAGSATRDETDAEAYCNASLWKRLPSFFSKSLASVQSLFETIRTISSVIQPKQPSEEFMARVSYAAQERLQSQVAEELREQISAEKIQRIIGMAVTVEDFRRNLFHDIVTACHSVGLSLTPKEIAALQHLKEDAVKEFANSLDERITKFFPTNLP